MGNAQSNQHTGQIVDSQKTQSAIVGTVINCPVGQTLTAVCTSNMNVKQGFEGFVSGGSSLIDGAKVPNWILSMFYICFIILFFGVIIAAIYENNK